MKKQRPTREWTFTMPRDHEGVFYLVTANTTEGYYHFKILNGASEEEDFKLRGWIGDILARTTSRKYARFLTVRPLLAQSPLPISAFQVSSGRLQEWLLTVDAGNSMRVVLSLQIQPKPAHRGREGTPKAITRPSKAAPSRRTTAPTTRRSASPSPKPSASWRRSTPSLPSTAAGR